MHRHRHLRQKISVQAARLDVGFSVRGKRDEERAVGGFRGSARSAGKMSELKVDVAIRRVRVDVATAVVDFDVAIDGVKVVN